MFVDFSDIKTVLVWSLEHCIFDHIKTINKNVLTFSSQKKIRYNLDLVK